VGMVVVCSCMVYNMCFLITIEILETIQVNCLE
jgi:hypothetical protein